MHGFQRFRVTWLASVAIAISLGHAPPAHAQLGDILGGGGGGGGGIRLPSVPNVSPGNLSRGAGQVVRKAPSYTRSQVTRSVPNVNRTLRIADSVVRRVPVNRVPSATNRTLTRSRTQVANTSRAISRNTDKLRRPVSDLDNQVTRTSRDVRRTTDDTRRKLASIDRDDDRRRGGDKDDHDWNWRDDDRRWWNSRWWYYRPDWGWWYWRWYAPYARWYPYYYDLRRWGSYSHSLPAQVYETQVVQAPVVEASEQAALGATFTESSRGAFVSELVPGGPAESGGLRVGDILVAANGDNITHYRQIIDMTRESRPGDRIDFEILADDGNLMVTVFLGARSAVY